MNKIFSLALMTIIVLSSGCVGYIDEGGNLRGVGIPPPNVIIIERTHTRTPIGYYQAPGGGYYVRCGYCGSYNHSSLDHRRREDDRRRYNDNYYDH